VSILSRLKGHLDDRALAAIWTDASLAGAPPADPHLDACAECRARMGAFASWLEDLRLAANAEADEVFTPERLATQHAQIFRRIEAAGRPARVIKFPRFAQPISATTSNARRWVAGAAAAGLLVGVALGQFMDLSSATPGRRIPVSTQATAETGAPNTPAGVGLQNASVAISDEELMSRIEEMVSPRIPDSLVAFDSMTPRVRDNPR
jgi:hypothetical protein